MMSNFRSYYLNLVSITFYTISTSIPFLREKCFKILVWQVFRSAKAQPIPLIK